MTPTRRNVTTLIRWISGFTKRNDGILKGDVTGVFVPFLLVDGLPGALLDEACVEDLILPVRM